MIQGGSTMRRSSACRSAAKTAVRPARLDADDLMMQRVSAGALHADARQHLAVLLDEVHDARRRRSGTKFSAR